MTLMDVAHDFAVVSILLAIGYFLRMKVKLFQRLFLPASIIGGLIGLIIGPQILGLYSPVHVTYTASISYTDFFGGNYNPINDRDFLAVSFGVNF